VHRDVKPANIMFDHDGRVMLTDFGISKALQAATGFTATGMIIGTPHYMAPEQGKGAPVDGRADQYSLGVVGYRMITAELPFGGDSVHTIIYKHIYEEPPLASAKRPGIPGGLTAAIARALSKDPHLRFPTMEDFATAVWPEQPVASPKKGKELGKGRAPARPPLRPATADAPTQITGAPTKPLSGARPQRSRAGAGAVIGLAVVAAAGVGGYLVLGRQGSEQRGAVPAVDTVRIQDTVRVPAQTNPPATPARAKPPKARPATPASEPQGFLTIAADPFGEVYIDGVDAGQTPLVEYVVKPGRHTVRIEHPGFKTVSEAVQVDASNTVRKRYTLLPE
jgi:serine/threonine-protein kinase